MKEIILKTKLDNPGWGIKRIAKAVGCSPNTVKYHLNSDVKIAYAHRSSKNRRINATALKMEYGGKCSIPTCGYDKCLDALQFHHVDPSGKIGSIQIMLRSVGKRAAIEEAKKCVLVCSNCHFELHSKDKKPVVGFAPTMSPLPMECSAISA